MSANPLIYIGTSGDRILAWNSANRNVYVYFDNDQKSAAPFDAAKFRSILRKRGATVP